MTYIITSYLLRTQPQKFASRTKELGYGSLGKMRSFFSFFSILPTDMTYIIKYYSMITQPREFASRTKELGSGSLGKMRLHKSGKVTLKLGEVRFQQENKTKKRSPYGQNDPTSAVPMHVRTHTHTHARTHASTHTHTALPDPSSGNCNTESSVYRCSRVRTDTWSLSW
ncbi:hypothetical protein T492DRAFT_38377 [Pavlovales sp. CCMP2436]|nr:hypothetical protein T492DRAFT_38377 [Pavlovales sp. CCMP2436]